MKTLSQEMFSKEIILKRVYNKKPVVMHKTTKEEYIKNCIWWIEEYFKGNCDKEKFDRSIFHLKNYAEPK